MTESFTCYLAINQKSSLDNWNIVLLTLDYGKPERNLNIGSVKDLAVIFYTFLDMKE